MAGPNRQENNPFGNPTNIWRKERNLGVSIKNKPNEPHDSSFVLEKYKSFFISNPMTLFLPLVTVVQGFIPYLDSIAKI